MESELLSDSQQAPLSQFLSQHALKPLQITPLKRDAGFREYFRITTSNQTYVLMDGSKSHENLPAFVAIARALKQQSICAPDIYHHDFERRLLLLSDFGDDTFLRVLNNTNAEHHYLSALSVLQQMQKIKYVPNHVLPIFDVAFMHLEWNWHKEWMLEKFLHLKINAALEKEYQTLITKIVQQPRVFMHRDYHSANLMDLKNGVGVLDFQDAFLGPITYDLVSLLRDCYITWPEHLIDNWVQKFYDALRVDGVIKNISSEEFHCWFDYMSIQRHLKTLMTFSRKAVRDANEQYLRHIPRTLNYIVHVTQKYAETKALHDYYHHIVTPAFEEKYSLCVP